MAILFAAGELESFINAGATGVSAVTTAGTFDSDYARSSIEVVGDGYVEAGNFTGQTEGWVHCEMVQDAVHGGQDFACIELVDTTATTAGVSAGAGAGSDVVFTMELNNGVDYQIKRWTGTALGDTQALLSDLDAGDLYVVDMHWNINASGWIRIYVNNALQASFEGDTTDADFTSIDAVRFLGGDDEVSAAQFNYSQIIVADEDTRGFHLATHDPTGASATNTAWTGDHLDVDNVDIDDATLVDSSSAADDETFSSTDLTAAAAAFEPRAVTLGMRAQKGATGPQNMRPMFRISATNYFGANVTGLTTAVWEPFYEIFALDPNTSAAWTTTSIDAMESGMQSVT